MAAWSDEIDEILGGDLVAALGYVTPAGGVVVTPVAPVGLRDRNEGTVTFTTPFALGKKLTRIEQNEKVALLYYLRMHGFAKRPNQLLVRGGAGFPHQPDPSWLRRLLDDVVPPYLGSPKRGRLWDWLMYEYYWVRVPVTVRIADLVDIGDASVRFFSGPGPAHSQDRPARGTAPRVSPEAAARRASRLGNTVLGFVGDDGYPMLLPVGVEDATEDGLELSSAIDLPAGERRAGLLSQRFGPQVVKQAVSLHTGWLTVTGSGLLYAPHTSIHYRAPGGETMLALLGGVEAKLRLASMRRKGLIDGERWVPLHERSSKTAGSAPMVAESLVTEEES